MKIAGSKDLKAIIKSTYDPGRYQHEFLKSVVNESKNTVFGKEHNFESIRNYEDFKKNVPIRTYDDHSPYIERMTKGEDDVLFPGKPFMYNTSSGTTGKPKLVPISNEFYQRLSRFNKQWFYSIVLDNPHIYDGRSLSSVGKAVEGYVEDGTPIGSISGNSIKTIPKVLKSTHSAPYPLYCIDDYDKKYYAIMRMAVMYNVTLSICPSIANILRYHQVFMDNFDDMINDIRLGTMPVDIMDMLDEEGRAEVEELLIPQPGRADELVKLKEKYGNDLKPKHYWPNLATMNAWVQGNFSLLMDKVKENFPETTVIRSFGYQASEGRFGISLANHWTYSVLVPGHYFYEFILEDEIDDENPAVYTLTEIEEGKRYFIFITNGSGLYRYDMNDIIEVCGRHNNSPLIKFIQKGAGITSITGEKLSEEQVILAVGEVSKSTGVDIKNYIMFADKKAFKYEFFAEFSKEIDTGKKRDFINQVDGKLKEYNLEYASKRGSSRLDQPILIELPEDSYDKIKRRLVSLGIAKDGQYKDLYLSKKPETHKILRELTMVSSI
ncbi:MAG: GH3 auxin-responsive promoter family protein [bacterium]|nr:GH3 auxin-responsive promoter family protein [bacterium]